MEDTPARKGIEVILGTISAAGLVTAIVSLLVFQFAWSAELVKWGLLGMGIGGAVFFLSFCVLKVIQTTNAN